MATAFKGMIILVLLRKAITCEWLIFLLFFGVFLYACTGLLFELCHSHLYCENRNVWQITSRKCKQRNPRGIT